MEDNITLIGVINPNDLHALMYMLSFYKKWLLLLANPAPLAERYEKFSELRLLLAKFSMLGDQQATLLTDGEIDCINQAIKAFVTQVEKQIPESENRAEVIENCERLRAYIIMTFKVTKE
ncbi:MAG TPA: hypothetical protein VGD98_26915 [Ktedonobacteraceae bacterium]